MIIDCLRQCSVVRQRKVTSRGHFMNEVLPHQAPILVPGATVGRVFVLRPFDKAMVDKTPHIWSHSMKSYEFRQRHALNDYSIVFHHTLYSATVTFMASRISNRWPGALVIDLLCFSLQTVGAVDYEQTNTLWERLGGWALQRCLVRSSNDTASTIYAVWPIDVFIVTSF